MSEAKIATLMEMGIKRGQAVTALGKYKGVMEAAEAIFSGEIEDDEEENEATSNVICDKDLKEEEQDHQDDESSIYDDISLLSESDHHVDYDPYKGLEMSKDTVKTVVELEQLPYTISVTLRGVKRQVKQMTQAQWMNGCPEGSEQSHLFALYQTLAEPMPHCPACKEPIKGREKSILVMFDAVEDYLDYLKETVQACCEKCKTKYCLACRATVSSSNLQESESDLWHCGEIQATVLGVGLAHIEQLLQSPTELCHSDELAQPNISSNGSHKKTKSQHTSDKDSSNKGTGYAGDVTENRVWHAQQRKKQFKADAALRQSLEMVRNYLPNTSRSSPYSSDYMPHIVSIAQVRRRYLPIVSYLLQSDSLIDMSERFHLYQEAVWEWFRAFARHETLVMLLAQPIMSASKIEYKIQKDKSREKIVTYKGSEGPRELAQSIISQCNAFLANLSKHEEAMKSKRELEKIIKDEKTRIATIIPKLDQEWRGEEDQLCKFAQSFIEEVATIDRLLRSTKGDAFVDKLLGSIKEPISMTPKKHEDVQEQIKAYETWAKAKCYDEIDMRANKSSSGKTRYLHAFNDKIRETDAGSNHKRGFIIAKELAGLRFSLPSMWHGSIFLRVDESRIDVLKACIVGPEGSPYENGLFMFDIFLPSTYNNTNPEVKIITTANGTVRHNPNLYANGKVCLSLLGTWAGPAWISGQSTLLQVLISIQSLVMGVEEPALNEPGWSSFAGNPSSIAYTKNCRRQTIAVAMLGHLKDPSPIWKGIIEGHFRLKTAYLCKQLDKWLQEDDQNETRGDGSSLIRHCDEEVEGARAKLENNVATIKSLLDELKVE